MENIQAATKFCSNCGAAIDANSTFCTNCGAQQVVQEPQYQEPQYAQPQYQEPQYTQPQYQEPQYQAPQYTQPQYTQPQYTQPQYTQQQYTQPQYSSYQEPEVSTKAKVFGIVGFATAMFGFVFGLINFLYGCTLVDLSYRYDDEKIICLFYAFVLIAFAIVGVAFSSSARSSGNESALTKLGKIFGIIAIPFIALTTFLMFVALA